MKKFLPVIAAVGIVVAGMTLVFGTSKPQPVPEAHDHDTHSHEQVASRQVDASQPLDLTNQSEVRMDISSYAYTQPYIKIKKGTKVTWTNQDPMRHNVMQQHEGHDHAHDAISRDEVKEDVFSGPLLDQGESYNFTFTQAGDITYHCAPHPGMQGRVVVVE